MIGLFHAMYIGIAGFPTVFYIDEVYFLLRILYPAVADVLLVKIVIYLCCKYVCRTMSDSGSSCDYTRETVIVPTHTWDRLLWPYKKELL